MMENSPDFLMAEGAMAKLGSIGALINTNLRGAALAHVLAQLDARACVLVDARLLAGASRELRPLEGADRLRRRPEPDALRRHAVPLAARGAGGARRRPSPTSPT